MSLGDSYIHVIWADALKINTDPSFLDSVLPQDRDWGRSKSFTEHFSAPRFDSPGLRGRKMVAGL